MLFDQNEVKPINPQLVSHHKLLKLRALSDRIVDCLAEPDTAGKVNRLQLLQRERDVLKATLPKLMVINK